MAGVSYDHTTIGSQPRDAVAATNARSACSEPPATSRKPSEVRTRASKATPKLSSEGASQRSAMSFSACRGHTSVAQVLAVGSADGEKALTSKDWLSANGEAAVAAARPRSATKPETREAIDTRRPDAGVASSSSSTLTRSARGYIMITANSERALFLRVFGSFPCPVFRPSIPTLSLCRYNDFYCRVMTGLASMINRLPVGVAFPDLQRRGAPAGEAAVAVAATPRSCDTASPPASSQAALCTRPSSSDSAAGKSGGCGAGAKRRLDMAGGRPLSAAWQQRRQRTGADRGGEGAAACGRRKDPSPSTADASAAMEPEAASASEAPRRIIRVHRASPPAAALTFDVLCADGLERRMPNAALRAHAPQLLVDFYESKIRLVARS